MAKPAYLIRVLSSEEGRLISYRLGAAWKTEKDNFRMHLPYYNTQTGDLIYLHDTEKEDPVVALAQYRCRRDQGNYTSLYRVFSAKKLPSGAGAVWFEKHGEIVRPAQTDLMLLQVRTLPYPNARCSLYFASIRTQEPVNEVDADMPFGEECNGLNEKDFI